MGSAESLVAAIPYSPKNFNKKSERHSSKGKKWGEEKGKVEAELCKQKQIPLKNEDLTFEPYFYCR